MAFELLTISDIIDKHKGTIAIIQCHGPSANDNVNQIKKLHEENETVVFGINEWHEFENDIIPDYWVRSFPQRPSIGEDPDYYNKHTNGTIPLLSCDVVDKTTLEDAMAKLNCPYLPYDLRHFNKETCSENFNKDPDHFLPRYFTFFPDCCNRRGRLTLQEEVQKYTNYSKFFSPSTHTSAINMIAFAIIMGCTTIYITGMDLDYFTERGRYANLKEEGYIPGQAGNSWSGWRQKWILHDFNIINESAKNIGTKIINLHPNPWYKTFELGTL